MPRLTPEERARGLAMLECGRTEKQTARRFHVSRSTLTRLIRRVGVTGTFADRSCSVIPSITTVRQDNYIRPLHLRDRFLTAESTSRVVVVGGRGQPIKSIYSLK